MAYAIERTPFFLDAGGRRLFAIHFASAAAAAAISGSARAALLLAPFAEEMNRSRRMMTLQAEALARHGVDVLTFDYSGTGDSSGEFAAARWDDWQADCDLALSWLLARGAAAVDVLGIRLGAMLACAAARRHRTAVRRLVLWQPVVSGSTFMTQFVRFRIAAALEASAQRETTKELRARFEVGETLEIAGYEVPGPLAGAIERLRLADLAPPAETPVDWFELSAEGGDVVPASEPVIVAWREAGANVRAASLPGEPFWTIQEMTIAPGLIAATTDALRTAGAAGQP